MNKIFLYLSVKKYELSELIESIYSNFDFVIDSKLFKEKCFYEL